MNIFATKDGKIYKVSMKNFVDATGKKAPYYRCIEKNGKVHENGYALCPGCNNPVHFVNLFNKARKRKKKKAHARHQRSGIKGLGSYNAATYAACPFGSKKAKVPAESLPVDNPSSSFCETISKDFGLSSESSELLSRIYFLIKNQNPEEAEHNFIALIASVSYYSPYTENPNNGRKELSISQLLFGLFWNAVADVKPDDQSKKHLASLGIAEDDINSLVSELRKQHVLLEDPSQSYYKKPDLTHLCATAATILTDSADKDFGGLVASGFSWTVSADASAGYIGDLCIADDAEPSMNDGDYKSDLDAVNIAALVKDNPNVSLLKVIDEYYSAIKTGQINRAHQFKENISMETLKNQRTAYYVRLQQSLLLSEASKESRIALFDKFVDCINQEKEDWPDD